RVRDIQVGRRRAHIAGPAGSRLAGDHGMGVLGGAVAAARTAASATQTTTITIVHSPCKPVGGQVAADLHALQTNAGHQRTRRGTPGVCEFEDLAIKLGVLELEPGAPLEIATDLLRAEPEV